MEGTPSGVVPAALAAFVTPGRISICTMAAAREEAVTKSRRDHSSLLVVAASFVVNLEQYGALLQTRAATRANPTLLDISGTVEYDK